MLKKREWETFMEGVGGFTDDYYEAIEGSRSEDEKSEVHGLQFADRSFEAQHQTPSPELQQAISESRNRENLLGPYDTAAEAIAAMLED